MNTAQLSQVLLAAWRQRDRSSPWGRWLIAALVVLPSVASALLLHGPARWGLPAGISLVIIHIGWLLMAANLQMQNTPSAARFVPGHVRALRQAGLLCWVACTAASCLLLVLVMPTRLLTWQAALLGSAAAVTFTMWSTRIWWLWLLFFFWGPLLGVLSEHLPLPLQAAQALWHEHQHLTLAAGLLGLGALMPAAFGQGDAAHRRAYGRLSRLQEMQRMFQEGHQATPAQAFVGLERFSRPFNAVITAWREHVLRRADNTSTASLLARAEIVLHANQHWVYQLLTAASIMASLALMLGVVVGWTGAPWQDLIHHGAFGITVGLGSMAVIPMLGRAMLWQTRREQALLRLLPGLPQGRAANRAVAWLSLRHALLAAVLAAVLILPLCRITDQWGLLWLPLMAVPWSLWTATRSPAHMRQPTGLRSMLPVMAYYLSAAVAYVGTERLGLPMVPWAVGLLAVSAAWGAWRWRRLDHQPAALPAGRLS
ncbi:hypothetical protein [Roseateles puraquae]|uniref:Uncharacterized protein n=1 Tax=Roseateles puraquae TaxID=431059 RepID=A0A254N4M1_9BURK|nr:hypothetical protein [Roseateles puraquae]MDG0853443.1 hypothetical protein [Roseateles puraquae]OWR03015.1 hypothetical protein CDO81_15660 [Roseateles puraquae]